MLVQCSKCKARLRATDENIRPDGSSIKCHECSSIVFFGKANTQKEAIDKLGIQHTHSKPKYSSDIAREIKNKTKRNPKIFISIIFIILFIIWKLFVSSKSWQAYIQQLIDNLDYL